MLLIKGKTFAGVYAQVLKKLMCEPEFIAYPRGQETREITNCIIEIEDPTSNIFTNAIRSTPKRYLAGELYWYFSGSNRLIDINQYSKFWNGLVNPDGKTVNSAYGYLLFKQQHASTFIDQYITYINEWQWALQALIKDKDSRQAIIRFNKPCHSWYGNKDFVCTLNGTFLIRNNKLYLTIIMRSQDEIFGRTFDVPFFTILQQQMLSHLKPTYPDLELGSYIQHNISTHIYQRDFKLIADMIDYPISPAWLPRLNKDLIWPSGSFNYTNFETITNPLINWIKENMT